MTDRVSNIQDDPDGVDIIGTGQDEIFETGAGNDIVDGGGGDDVIITNEGDDILLGGDGNDRLFGCEGDDVLDGGSGADFLNGGTGDDLLIFRKSENTSNRPDYYDGFADSDTLRLVLTAAEFAAARADIAAFQAYIAQTTVGGISTGPFFFFESLNLMARRIETLQVVVDGEFVIGEPDIGVEDDQDAVTAGGTVSGSVASNDDLPAGSIYALVETVDEGTLSFGEDGRYVFDPGSDFDDLGAGETRTISFVYEATTPEGQSARATATITVTGVNDDPVAGADARLSVSETDAAFTVDVLAGASDVDGDALSVGTVRVLSGDGEALSVQDGVVTFDPAIFADRLDEGDMARVVFEVQILDGNGGVATRTFTVDVAGASDAPELELENDSARILVGSPLLDGSVAANDSVPDGAVFSLVEGVDRGTLVLNSDGTFSFDPGSDFDDLIVGSDLDPETATQTFTYRVTTADGST
ncbi:MAG: Ig-like domain-containing protein, partial [Litorimonas sp.]